MEMDTPPTPSPSISGKHMPGLLYERYTIDYEKSGSRSDRLSEELDIEMCRLEEMMTSLDVLDQELKGRGEADPGGTGIIDPGGGRAMDTKRDTLKQKRSRADQSKTGMDKSKNPRGSGIPLFVGQGCSVGSPYPTRSPLSQRTVPGAEHSPVPNGNANTHGHHGASDGRLHESRNKTERHTSGPPGGGGSHMPGSREDAGRGRQAPQGGEIVTTQPSSSGESHRGVDTDQDKGGYSTVDYPIRGTISPLTNQVMVKRSVGPVDEVSFVFGRPASPRSERAGTRCLSPLSDKRPPPSHSDIVPLRSSAPQSGVGSGNMGGILCENCNSSLIELKRQALRLVFPDNEARGIPLKALSMERVEDKLQVPESFRKYGRQQKCDVCETPLRQLKQEAVAMIRSIQHAQHTSGANANIPALVGSCNIIPTQHRSANGRFSRQGKYQSCSGPGLPIAAQAQAYLEQNVRAWIQPKKCNQMLVGRSTPQEKMHTPMDNMDPTGQHGHSTLPQPIYHTPSPHWHPSQGQVTPNQPYPVQRVMSPGPGSPPPNPSAAVSFFARAAQKLSRKKKRHQPPDPEPPPFPTSFCDVIRLSPPPAPPGLLRGVSRLTNPGMGKVKVMLKVCTPNTISQGEQGNSFLNIDPRKKQITVFDPSASGYTTAASRRAGIPAPKMFAFDAIFSPDDSLAELCSSSLSEIVQAVVNGADGCLFTFGHSKLGKSFTMIGSDESSQTLGIVPCAVAWLFKLINEQKEKTGARFSVRVSAVEVTGRQEVLHDLLADVAQSQETTGVGTAPGVYLREDPICGTQLENQSELRAPTAEKAAYYLDAALAARSPADEEGRSSHVLFTLHVYQYRIEKTNTKAGLPGVAGGRSRLHLIDLGSTSKSKDPNNVALSLSALGNVILALVNGQRHVPHRDSKIAQLLRDSLGNMSCRTCMIAHVSSGMARYNETLQVIQLAARIHRMKRRRTKFSSTSSEDSSTDESGLNFRRPYRGFRMGTLREDVLYSSSHSDPDYTSSSEQSCDTVIYLGANGQSLSDRELTDNEGPPRHVPRTNPRLPRRPSGSRSSGDEGSNSDSGRSMTYSEPYHHGHRGSPLRSVTPVNGCVQMYGRDQMHSAPGSPQPGAVSKRANVRTKAVISRPQLPGEIKEANAHWSEKGRQHSQHPPHSPHHSKRSMRGNQESKSLQGEQWIDGPGAAIYPEKKAKELWVDGPQAFVVPPDTPKTAARFNRKVSSEEQWVDGPTEMIAGQKKSKAEAPPPAATASPKPGMHSSCKFEYRESSAEPKSSPSHQKSKVPKQATLTKIDGKDRPESTISLDSNLSTKAEAADSRPVSLLEPAEGQKTDGPKAEAAPETIKVKPFVRDWVQRHGVVNESEGQNDAETGMFIVDSDNRVIGTLESMSGKKSQKLHEQVAKKLLAASPRHSPKSSPSLSRKDKESKSEEKNDPKVQKLPSQPHPTNRVAEWIKSVSFEQGLDASAKGDNSDVVMADAETNTEHDSDFERMAASDASLKGVPAEAPVDTSFDSSMGTGDYNESLLNRESMYEIQVEERLEGLKRGSRVTSDVPDDETFSSRSRTDENDKDCENTPLLESSATEEHVRALISGSSEVSRGIKKMCDRDTSPVPSDYDNEDDIVPELSRPLLFRKPDGASNPNLLKAVFQEGLADQLKLKDSYHGESVSIETMYATSSHNDSGISGVSDLPPTSNYSLGPCKPGLTGSDYSAQDVQSGKIGSSKMPIRSKPPLPSKPSPSSKPSSLPKPSGSAPSSPSRQISPSKNSHKDLSPNQKSKSTSLPVSSHNGRKDKDRSVKGQKSTSHIAGSPPGNGMSKTASKSPKAAHSKLPIFGSKPTSPAKESKLRKKEKEGKFSKLGNGRVSELVHKNKGTDSDSGNDSGIVTVHKKLLSPYATVTKPRTPSHSSSGHGSDNSSTISTDIHSHHCNKSDKLHGGTSSGYESMLRDSEATGSSSGEQDSADESSGEKKRGSKKKGTRRSRSAPARSSESPPDSCKQSPSVSRKAMSPSPRTWGESRHAAKVNDEPLDIQSYDAIDVERLQRRRTDEKESKLSEQQKKERVKELITKQDDLKQELTAAKDRIMMERSTWSFDLFVSGQCDIDEEGFVEALERETQILEKRVEACQSHVMMVTCFDGTSKSLSDSSLNKHYC